MEQHGGGGGATIAHHRAAFPASLQLRQPLLLRECRLLTAAHWRELMPLVEPLEVAV